MGLTPVHDETLYLFLDTIRERIYDRFIRIRLSHTERVEKTFVGMGRRTQPLFKENAMNKYTLITGASGGIGWELARQFAAGGHPLILVARSEARLQERQAQLQEEYAVPVVVMAQDLT